jgi:hypothetical protein
MTTPEWVPDIAIDTALAARLIAEQFRRCRGTLSRRRSCDPRNR